jgi:hypothetical protein
MPNTPKKPKPKIKVAKKALKLEDKNLTKEELNSFVKEQVISKLGRPDTLKFIKAANVFDNNWRVDVWCHFESEVAMIRPAKIKHSYFIRVNEHGKITNSDPEIKKEY